MPATEEYARNLRSLHVVSAASAFVLLGATLWMMQADYADEWRGIQKVATEAEAQKIDDDLLKLETKDFETEEARLKEAVEAGRNAVKAEQDKVDKAAAEVSHLEGQSQKLTRDVKFQNAKRDKTRADYDLKVRDEASREELSNYRKIFEGEQTKADNGALELQQLQAKLDEANKTLAALTKPRDEALAAKKKHETELDRLTKAKEIIAPDPKKPSEVGMAFKRWLMQLPIIEGFNGPVKVNQIWLPDLTVTLGMKEAARYDRCITCHVNIDKVQTGNVLDYPHDPHGISMKNADEYLHGKKVTSSDGTTVVKKKSRVREDGSIVGYNHPFSTHPNPDLYLTAASPHPMQKFGCTSCHEGQGSGTSFQNASHSPNSPDIAEKWHKDYGYSYNHFWEYPMFPERLREAACLKCHHNVVELGVNPKFGNSAPTVFKGYELIRQYGCFGCHEINGYAAGKPIGPDMRLEPQTPEEAERIAADPLAVAGTMRKVGPGLRHFAAKTTRGWTENWVEEPKRFRPETRMPQFFNLTNQSDKHAKELQPVEIAGIVEYLFSKSEKLTLEHWDAAYTPDAERGKLLFSQRGCAACHSHDDLVGGKADFGPNLTNAHQKIASIEWLYTWLREPTRHSARTRMPNLYLEPETVNGVTVNPAADIAAFLLVKRDDQGKALPDGDGKLVHDDVGPGRFKQLVQPGVYLGCTFAPTRERTGWRGQATDGPRGAKVASVMPGSPASRTFRVAAPAEEKGAKGTSADSLAAGDVIVRYKGIDVRDAAHLEELVSASPAGEEVTISISRQGANLEMHLTPDTPLHDLTRWYLSKVMTAAKVSAALKTKSYPETEAAAIKAASVKPDEVELINGEITDETMLRYIGRRSISRYGCYGCHDIPGFEKARPIGTGLFDWGRKDPTKLALEHIEEYLHHHGEADGSSTAQRAEKALLNGVNDNFDSVEERDRETAVGYFFDQLNHHGRAGFLWQKLRDPRSYDFKKIETKGYDERLRMPKFPFSESDIEAITTFVLGLVGEPPAVKYVYHPSVPAKSRIEGEKLLAKFNCTGCHMVELPEITGVPEDLTPYKLEASDFPQALDLLLKVRPPRDARTTRKLPTGEDAIKFHAMLVQPINPDDDPEDQSAFYDLWEPITIGDKGDINKLLLPPNRIELKAKKLLSQTTGRGGAFSEWLVDASVKGTVGPKVERSVAREMAPPTLFEEGIKVQTPWLYAFLKSPDRLRYTTVLRMPHFNMSNDEAEKLANYFAAVDSASFPYQEIPQREPQYLETKEHEHPHYLRDAWEVITKAPPTGVCAGCHAVGGREFVAGNDPTKVTRGPNLDRVYSRLQPDWLQIWLYNPKWITPYTRMPQNFVGNKEMFPELFGGKGQLQAVAARDALMNYLQLLEKEGKATAAVAAQPAGAEGDK
jgi:mono/diheme cytochrome c family protein